MSIYNAVATLIGHHLQRDKSTGRFEFATNTFRHPESITGRDTTVAKRMALLVFTDFACWAPIAFFGLTAVAGYPLIDMTNSKILLVFFYPLNSCANPFLYAILTRQYRRDLFILLARYGLCTQRASKYKDASSGLGHNPHAAAPGRKLIN